MHVSCVCLQCYIHFVISCLQVLCIICNVTHRFVFVGDRGFSELYIQ